MEMFQKEYEMGMDSIGRGGGRKGGQYLEGRFLLVGFCNNLGERIRIVDWENIKELFVSVL